MHTPLLKWEMQTILAAVKMVSHHRAPNWRSARAELCSKASLQKQCCALLGKKWDRLPVEVGQHSHTPMVHS